jgi:predicted dehydrogenase
MTYARTQWECGNAASQLREGSVSERKRELRIAMIGYQFMGAAHSQGWRVAPRFFRLGAEPVLQTIVGRDAQKLEAARDMLGWRTATTDWREVIDDPAIDIVDISSPGWTHAEIAIAALEAGKHVICEKPLANTLNEAEHMAAAAAAASARGVRSMVAFNYRRVPAVSLAREMIRQGRLGAIRQVRALYLQDWLSDPDTPMSWRLDRELAGAGALGDIGAHAIDAVHFLTSSEITSVTGSTCTFVDRRPSSTGEDSELRDVTVDDAAWFNARLSGGFADGAMGSFEATRFATGRKNSFQLELSGSSGALLFDLQRLNELAFYDATLPEGEQGFTKILATHETHPYMANWWPNGNALGWEHTFVHEIKDFIEAIVNETDPSPSFQDGLDTQRVIDAVEVSSANGSKWVTVRPDTIDT